MAEFISALSKSSAYTGLGGIFEFVNDDGRLKKWNCGQAAAATLLTHLGVSLPETDSMMRAIERRFPPDILGGWLGTSRRRVERIFRSFATPLEIVRGEEALRSRVANGTPVIVMLAAEAGRLWRMRLPGGHWMVAYGFDEDSIHLTNWHEPMPWTEFRERWRSKVSRLIGMNERGLSAKLGPFTPAPESPPKSWPPTTH